MSIDRLSGIVGYQARVIQFAEELIDRQGLTVGYRRALWLALKRDVERGEADYPDDLMAAAAGAAQSNGLPVPENGRAGPLPLDDYLSEVMP